MQPKIILILLLLLVVNLQLRANGVINVNAAQTGSVKADSVRNEFNLKKKNTQSLVGNKKSETVLNYYRFYLQEKDRSRADSLISYLLKNDSGVEVRYNISLISNFYTADSKTRMLFLSNPDSLKAYRAYFLKHGSSTIKSNIDIRTHYYNLAALDSAYYQIAPDSVVKLQMARHYNSLAWYSILTQKFANVAHYLNQSLKYDPQSNFPKSNLPLLLLLEGHYDKAKALYLKYKDQPFDETHLTYKEEFLEDFGELEKEGITNPNIKKITRLLNDK